jgi:hypothetical protein
MRVKVAFQARSSTGTVFDWRGTVDLKPGSDWMRVINHARAAIAPDVGDADLRKITITLPKKAKAA